MQKEADTFISNNERSFIQNALKQDLRIDGRNLLDFRKVKFIFSLDDASATVVLGTTNCTRVLAVVAATLEPPFRDRPSEGQVRFNVELSPAASPAFEAGRPSEDAIEIARLVERGLKQSRAIDMEALCVLAGRKVWSLRIDIHVLDHGGNLADACALAALAALMAFRRPHVNVGGKNGTEIQIIPPEVKEPLALTLHHLPLAVSFALFDAGNTVVVDPALKEEAASEGKLTVIVNPAREVCAIQKAEGVGMSAEQLMRCVRIACARSEELLASLRSALSAHDVARVQARVRRQRQVMALPAPGRNVAVMASGEQVAGDKLLAEIPMETHVEESDDSDSSDSSSSSDDDGSSETSSQDEGEAMEGVTPAPPSTPPPTPTTQPQTPSGKTAVASSGGLKSGKLAVTESPGSQGRQANLGPRLSSGLHLSDSKSPAARAALASHKKPAATALPAAADPLEAIAALIAGAGRQGGPPATDLAQAIRPGKGKKGNK